MTEDVRTLLRTAAPIRVPALDFPRAARRGAADARRRGAAAILGSLGVAAALAVGAAVIVGPTDQLTAGPSRIEQPGVPSPAETTGPPVPLMADGPCGGLTATAGPPSMAEPWRIQPGSDRNLITMPGGSLLVLTTNGVCSDRLSFHTAGPLLRGQEKEEGGSFNDAGAAVVVISDTQQGMESIAVYLDCAAVADCTEAAPLAVVTVRIGAPPSATPPGMPPAADPDLPAVPASWRVAATADNGTVLDLLVNEIGCASGRPADGRIRTSAEYRADAVVVTVLVKPRSGAQSCPGNPDTRYTLRLDEPIGSRVLLDGGQSPPAPPPPASSD